jgi:CheY-like chemotaxis protein
MVQAGIQNRLTDRYRRASPTYSRAKQARHAFPLEQMAGFAFCAVVKAWTTHGKHMEKAVVLVVEDEALIRISALHIVADAGFDVLEACNADEALAILDSRNDIRAVLTDIRMPGSMDGWELAGAIRRRWPPMHLVVASAHAPNGGILPANGRFIGKPYTAEQITTALYELFEHDLDAGPIMRDIDRNRARVN